MTDAPLPQGHRLNPLNYIDDTTAYWIATGFKAAYVAVVAIVAFRTAMWAIWFLFIPH